MGVTKIMKQISRYRNRCEEDLELAARLQKTEENNIHQMKQYLRTDKRMPGHTDHWSVCPGTFVIMKEGYTV